MTADRRRHSTVGLAALALLASCASAPSEPSTGAPPSSPTTVATTSPSAAPMPEMPDLVGLPAPAAGRRLGELEARTRIGLSSAWGRPVTVRCEARPGSVVRQHPAPGTPLGRRPRVRVRTAALDLARFRGPCSPVDGVRGIRGVEAEIAEQFYRFAADPDLGAPFVDGPVRVRLGTGPGAVVGEDVRTALTAWELSGPYAERSGPLSPLDVVAASGGYYEVRRGVVAECFTGAAQEPTAPARAISLVARADAVDSCMNWWGVTLHLDAEDRISEVVLRLGSP